MPLSQDKFAVVYTDYLDSVQALRETVPTFDSFVLTGEEKKALETAPDYMYDIISDTLGKYTPTAQDIREQMIMKFLAVWLLETSKTIGAAVKIGYDFGEAIS